jgi:uncharacterized protein YktA (UPF0223 family)
MDNRVWYNQVRKQFTDTIYEGVLAPNHISGGEVKVKYDEDYYYGFKLKKGLYTYFLQSEHLEHLPLKVTRSEKFDYKGDVMSFIRGLQSINMTPEEKMSFRQLVDSYNNFAHTNPDDWTLAKICALGAFITRVNLRFITEQGLGKDSLVNGVIELSEDGSNIYKATLAKLEYELRNKYIVINEVSTSKKDDKELFEQFFLEAGAFSNTYLARSRAVSGGAGKKERYDISKTSILVLQNTPEYYLETNKDLFETVFTRAVYHRFLPVFLEGHLSEEFNANFDFDQVLSDNKDELVDWIKTLYYYREQDVNPIDSPFVFTEEELRFKLNFDKLYALIKMYDGGDTGERLAARLYGQFDAYKKSLKDLGLVYY